MSTPPPRLPVKLPLGMRKKLSIDFTTTSPPKTPVKEEQEKNSNIYANLDQKEINPSTSATTYIYYTDPMLQPIMPSKTVESNSDLPSPDSFFNDSIYQEVRNLPHSPIQERVENLAVFAEFQTDIKSYDTPTTSCYLNLNEFKTESMNGQQLEVNADQRYLPMSQMSEVTLNESSSPPVDISASQFSIAPPPPPIPPKRQKTPSMSLQNESLRLKMHSKTSLPHLKDSSFVAGHEETSYEGVYNQPTSEIHEKFESSLDIFKREIYKNSENKNCADCKSGHNAFPKWISCLYLITLCDTCARIHLKMPHEFNKFYIIEVEPLHKELIASSAVTSNKDMCLSVEKFLSLFNKCGNEIMNSLLEYQVEQARTVYNTTNIENFIRQKYLNKKFINENELDLSLNFVEDLNKTLLDCLSGNCISMTAYYLFLGANKCNTELITMSPLQYLYMFYFQNVSKTGRVDFLGELAQQVQLTTNKVKFKIHLKLSKHYLTIIHLNDTSKQLNINLDSIFMLYNIRSKTGEYLVEVKFHENNKCFSTSLQFFNENETQIWLKQLMIKFLYKSVQVYAASIMTLINKIAECQVTSMGYMESEQKCLVFLLESLLSQSDKFYRKNLVIVRLGNEVESTSKVEVLDMRKLSRVKLIEKNSILYIEQADVIKKIMFRSVTLSSTKEEDDYLNLWKEKLDTFSSLDFKSIEDQYLSKDDCPILVNKVMSYIEVKHVMEANIYHGNNLHQSLETSVDFFTNTLTMASNKRMYNLYAKLEREREFRLDASAHVTVEILIKILRIFFRKNVNYVLHLSKLVEIVLENEHNDDQRLVDKLKFLFENENYRKLYFVFYSMLKRLCIHLNLVLKYSSLNNVDEKDLISLFSSLLLDSVDCECFNSFNRLLRVLVKNSVVVFDINVNYFKIQYEIFDKLIEFKHLSVKK